MKKLSIAAACSFATIGISLPFLTSCDSAPINSEVFDFAVPRFDVEAMAAAPSDVSPVPVFLLDGDVITITPAGLTTSHDEDYIPEMSRYGTVFNVVGQNSTTFQRSNDPATQFLFPDLTANWEAEIGSSVGELISQYTVTPLAILNFTQGAVDDADGDQFDPDNDLDGTISEALFQEFLPDVAILEDKGEFIEQECKDLGQEVYNNADFGILKMLPYPAMRATIRRIFVFESTSTNQEVLDTSMVSGNYQIVEQYVHMMTRNKFGEEDYIFMYQTDDFGFSGTKVVESGTFTIELTSL